MLILVIPRCTEEPAGPYHLFDNRKLWWESWRLVERPGYIHDLLLAYRPRGTTRHNRMFSPRLNVTYLNNDLHTSLHISNSNDQTQAFGTTSDDFGLRGYPGSCWAIICADKYLVLDA